MSKSPLKRGGIANWALYQSGEILGVINPNINRRNAIQGTSEEMASAAIALAIRQRPPEAVALAIMAAHKRHSRVTYRN